MKFPTLSKTLVGGATATMLFAGSFTANAAERFSHAVPDWTGGAVVCELVKNIVETQLGHKVKSITMPSGSGVFEAIASGDLDYGCELWPSYSPEHKVMVKEFGGDGTMAFMGETGVVGTSTYYVPKYFIDEVAPDLKSYKQLNKYKEHFTALETDGKGKLLACPTPAWGCDDQARLDALGVDFVAVELGTETALWAEAQGAYARKEPFLLYAWTPHWIHAALELVPIELPAFDADKWPAVGWDTDVTFNYGNPERMAASPDVAYVLSNMNLSNEEQNKIVLAVDVDGKDIEVAVQEWMDENEGIWHQWVPSS